MAMESDESSEDEEVSSSVCVKVAMADPGIGRIPHRGVQ